MAEELEVLSSDILLLLQHDIFSSSKDHNFPLGKSLQISPTGSDKGIDPNLYGFLVAILNGYIRVSVGFI